MTDRQASIDRTFRGGGLYGRRCARRMRQVLGSKREIMLPIRKLSRNEQGNVDVRSAPGLFVGNRAFVAGAELRALKGWA